VTAEVVSDGTCVCGHTAATAHDIVDTPAGLRFGPCIKADCRCAGFDQRLVYAGGCESCRAYRDVGYDLMADWYVAPRADQPPLSNQIARSLVMYLEHIATHTAPTA
jgi:hypothetical protein